MEDKFLKFPSNTQEAVSLDDCIVIACPSSNWLVVPFRGDFIKCRITRERYKELTR